MSLSTSCSFIPAERSRAACHSSNSAAVRLLEATKKKPVLSSLPAMSPGRPLNWSELIRRSSSSALYSSLDNGFLSHITSKSLRI
ncbi:Os03g0731850 [Oryza sativa Japonica Group]|uniref:Os03g0731850 protein n=1 Tax=Oryza sativa subsp. japonica TaxID=39947 RepID=A0A0P0W390_ORYSJ|nr:hypothetical protein EE612_020250 [Oryza sativa]BAS86227.1 Os03g0731850 [Oryza sativa Japonica Group]